MPNYVKNFLKFKKLKKGDCEEILKKFIVNDNFDFNTIIPMPDYIYKGDLGREEEKKYGKNNWYDWSLENWGTKWNSCYTRIQKGTTSMVIEFDTAWDTPMPIYEKLAELGYNFEVRYADEDIGNNCGKFEYIEGEFKEYELKDTYKFARRIWG